MPELQACSCQKNMAEKRALKNLEDQLNCAICLETYTEPKVLRCHHVYCKKCLVRLVVRDLQGELSLTCPKCRQTTPVPDNCVESLQPAFEVNHFLDIIHEYKKTKDTTVSILVETDGDVAPSVQSRNATSHCSLHEGQKLELYCEKCNELICYVCVYKGGSHYKHNTEKIGTLVEKQKGEILSSLKPMEEKLLIVNKALMQLDACSGEISDQRGTIETSIHNKFQQLQELLHVKKTELIGHLHQITQGKLKVLATQRDQIETIQVQMSSCLDFVKERLNTDSHGEILKMKTTVVKQVNEITAAFQPDALKPNTEADITLSVSPDVTAVCRNYAQVYAARDPDLSKCHATGKGLEEAIVGEKSIALIEAFNYMGIPCTELIQSLQCEVVFQKTGLKVRGNVKRTGQNQYEISYKPTMKGRHDLCLKLNDQHIKGSPFPVTVKLPVKQLGILIQTMHDVNAPWGVAINQRREVVVSDFMKNCVSILSPTGEKLKSFGTLGSGHGQFSTPCGVAVDGEENIIVVDGENHRIQKFTANGQFLTAVGTNGSGPLQFENPKGIAYNASNNKLYVTDGGNNRVQVLNSDLTFFSTFGEKGRVEGQFNDPRGIACGSTGKVYVADSGNSCIQVFTSDGTILNIWGGHDSETRVSGPNGIAVDVNDIVYINEFSNDRILMFTSEGQFVTSFSCMSDQGEFSHISGIAVDDVGMVYVCDSVNSCIRIF